MGDLLSWNSWNWVHSSYASLLPVHTSFYTGLSYPHSSQRTALVRPHWVHILFCHLLFSSSSKHPEVKYNESLRNRYTWYIFSPTFKGRQFLWFPNWLYLKQDLPKMSLLVKKGNSISREQILSLRVDPNQQGRKKTFSTELPPQKVYHLPSSLLTMPLKEIYTLFKSRQTEWDIKHQSFHENLQVSQYVGQCQVVCTCISTVHTDYIYKPSRFCLQLQT